MYRQVQRYIYTPSIRVAAQGSTRETLHLSRREHCALVPRDREVRSAVLPERGINANSGRDCAHVSSSFCDTGAALESCGVRWCRNNGV